MKKKLLIFDFDGVLADSFDQVYEINRVALLDTLDQTLTKKEYCNLFDGSFHKRLISFLNVSDKELADFMQKKYEIYEEYYSNVQLFDFADSLVTDLHNAGHKLAIVSSAQESSILSLLERYSLRDKFFFIAGMNKDGKIKNIKKCIDISNNNITNSYFITDTIGDVKEGTSVGVHTVAVTWGFQKVGLLEKQKPTYIISVPEDIKNL